MPRVSQDKLEIMGVEAGEDLCHGRSDIAPASAALYREA